MFSAGVHEVEITPPLGTELSGYSARPGPAAGVHDALYARALVLDDGQARVGLVTCDLIGFDRELVGAIRGEVGRRGALAPEHLLLTATHTHAGPMVSCLSRMGQLDTRYLGELQGRIAEAVCQAAGSLQPAKLGYAVGKAAIGINRREMTESGVTIGRNPGTVIDRDVCVLAVARVDGSPLAILVNHACHGTTMGSDNVLVSADWPGEAVRTVAEGVPGAVVMVANGCCGDVNPDPRGTFELVAEHGRTVGKEALKVLEEIKYAEVPVRVHSEPVTISLQPMPGLEQAQASYQECVTNLRRAEWGEDAGAKRTARGLYQWAADLLRHAQAGTAPDPPTSEVQAIGLGAVGLVGLPGEPFTELGRNIKAAAVFPHTLVLGYAGAMIGYLPTEAAFAEGGYEVEGAVRWYGVLPLSPQTQYVVEEAALTALRAVAE